jgi:hypothetical protein
MTKRGKSKCSAKPTESPMTAPSVPPRLIEIPDLYNSRGEPVLALATGSLGRPVLQVFRSTAAALAAHREGGAV